MWLPPNDIHSAHNLCALNGIPPPLMTAKSAWWASFAYLLAHLACRIQYSHNSDTALLGNIQYHSSLLHWMGLWLNVIIFSCLGNIVTTTLRTKVTHLVQVIVIFLQRLYWLMIVPNECPAWTVQHSHRACTICWSTGLQARNYSKQAVTGKHRCINNVRHSLHIAVHLPAIVVPTCSACNITALWIYCAIEFYR